MISEVGAAIEDGRMTRALTVRGMAGRPIGGAATGVAIGNRAGTHSVTQPSSVATSGATPGGSGNTVASSAGNRSITVRRVSMVVPRLAKTAPAMAALKTTRPR